MFGELVSRIIGAPRFSAGKLLSELIICSLLLTGWPAGSAYALAGTTRYVKPAGLTSGSCGSWANACKLQYALGVAGAGDQLWVEQGTYKPTSGVDRTISFALISSVRIYGGFAGTETLLSQRDPVVHATILSGDIGTIGDPSDNSYHVVTGSGTDSTAVLDGFTITAGNADAASPTDYADHSGGGMYNSGGSPSLANIIFSSNTASYGGGGMQDETNSSPGLTNVTFTNNTAPDGGGMYNTGLSKPTLTNVTFSANTSNGSFGGGGMFNDGGSDAILTGVTFTGNSASGNVGGAMVNQDGSNPSVTNVTFSANSGSNGGAVYNTNGSPTFTNVSFSANTASGSGGAMYNDTGATVSIRDDIFWGDGSNEIVNASTGTSTVDDSVVSGGCPSGSTCSNVFNSDPLLGALQNNGGLTETMAISPGSSALDAGNDSTCAGTDQRGVTRPQGPHCDIGAYEHVYSPILYARPVGLTSGWCDSWANSCRLAYALHIAVSGEQIWAKAGTYFPTTGSDRTLSFILKDGVAIYGGFVGFEAQLDRRNPGLNLSILDGNIGSALTPSDNSYHVVDGARTDGTAVLDGFTIADGNANGGSFDNDGAGMTNGGSPTLRNITFAGNTAASFGGGMYNNDGSPSLTNVTFLSNSAGLGGGGMYNNTNSPSLTNVTFGANTASSYGGGMENDYSTPALTNVTFSGNSASSGGGALDNFHSNPQINDTILWGDGSEFDDLSSAPVVNDSVVEGGCPSGAACTHIINSDPLLGPLQNNGGFSRTMALLSGSPAINSGNDSTCAATDQRGVIRPRGTHCDMGAYETFGTPPTFADVPAIYWAWKYIEALYQDGITGGCGVSPLIYCPTSSVTRAQMAIFLERGMHGSGFVPPVVSLTFSDTSANFAKYWIEALKNDGITSGCGGGKYCPDDAVTRDQMAIFLLRSKYGSGFVPPAATGTVFTDVPISYWDAAWIEKLAADGISGGCGGGNYCPTNSVTRDQMAVFLVKTFNLPLP